jgi:hypothetical protein
MLQGMCASFSLENVCQSSSNHCSNVGRDLMPSHVFGSNLFRSPASACVYFQILGDNRQLEVKFFARFLRLFTQHFRYAIIPTPQVFAISEMIPLSKNGGGVDRLAEVLHADFISCFSKSVECEGQSTRITFGSWELVNRIQQMVFRDNPDIVSKAQLSTTFFNPSSYFIGCPPSVIWAQGDPVDEIFALNRGSYNRIFEKTLQEFNKDVGAFVRKPLHE